jgi:hypothetical protein
VRIRIWLIVSLLAGATSCLYMARVLLPWEYSLDVTHGRLKADMGDLYPRWVGTRELLLHGHNPYGLEVTHEIEMGFYGHPIAQRYDQPGVAPIDEQRFAYPIYVVFLMAATIPVDFASVHAWAPVVFASLIAASVLLWMAFLRWRPPPSVAIAIVLFILASPQVLQGLRLRQLGMFVALLLAAGAWCVRRNWLGLAGILFAVSTIKPQMVFLPLAWFLLWGLGEWRKRWRLLIGFAAALALLIGLGEFILPGWIGYFIDGIRAYQKYVPVRSLLWLVFGNPVGKLLSAAIIAGMLFIGWRCRHYDASSDEFARISAMFFVGATIVLPLMTPFNQVLLLLPVMMILRDWDNLARIPRSTFAIVVAWPWLASLVLVIHRPDLNSMRRTPLLPSALVLLLPLIVALLCLPRASRSPSLLSRTAGG